MPVSKNQQQSNRLLVFKTFDFCVSPSFCQWSAPLPSSQLTGKSMGYTAKEVGDDNASLPGFSRPMNPRVGAQAEKLSIYTESIPFCSGSVL